MREDSLVCTDHNMKPPLLEFKNVSITRDRRVLFSNLNWTIRMGERWALIGPAGSGKTSIAEALAGTRRVVRGSIRYSFTEDDTPSEREVILLSSESQMNARASISPYYQARWNSYEEEDSRTVRYFMSAQGIYGLSEYHILSAEEVPSHFPVCRRDALEATGAAPLLNRKLMDLSNGELRKVLLARALAQKPHLLILDDPLSGLDARSQQAFHKVVKTAAQFGINLVFIASSFEDLPANCATHLLQVKRRQVVFSGPVSRGPYRILRQRMHGVIRQCGETAGKPGEIAIEINNSSVRYGRTYVLKNVTWRVRYREKWAVLGPNGAGKTTLLGLILGDNPQAYACDIRIFGRARGSGESIWDIKKDIGHVAPEVQSFLPLDQTGEMIVCSGMFDSIGLYRRCPKAGRKSAAGIMRKLGIARLKTRMMGEMSSSEQRLVLIARALVKRPRVLILDELCQGLDAATRRRMLELLDRLASDGAVTLIVVAHRARDLPRSITKLLYLDDGRASLWPDRNNLPRDL